MNYCRVPTFVIMIQKLLEKQLSHDYGSGSRLIQAIINKALNLQRQKPDDAMTIFAALSLCAAKHLEPRLTSFYRFCLYNKRYLLIRTKVIRAVDDFDVDQGKVKQCLCSYSAKVLKREIFRIRKIQESNERDGSAIYGLFSRNGSSRYGRSSVSVSQEEHSTPYNSPCSNDCSQKVGESDDDDYYEESPRHHTVESYFGSHESMMEELTGSRYGCWDNSP